MTLGQSAPCPSNSWNTFDLGGLVANRLSEGPEFDQGMTTDTLLEHLFGAGRATRRSFGSAVSSGSGMLQSFSPDASKGDQDGQLLQQLRLLQELVPKHTQRHSQFEAREQPIHPRVGAGADAGPFPPRGGRRSPDEHCVSSAALE